MIKAPLVKLEKNHRSEILFWTLNAIIFFIMWFILFPSMTITNKIDFRSSCLVLCCLNFNDRYQNVYSLRHGKSQSI